VVDQLRAAIYQSLPGADDGHVGLGALTPVLERVRELRVQARQAGEVLSIDLVELAHTGIDEPQFAGVGNQHLVATLLQEPANPGRVGSGLDPRCEKAAPKRNVA